MQLHLAALALLLAPACAAPPEAVDAARDRDQGPHLPTELASAVFVWGDPGRTGSAQVVTRDRVLDELEAGFLDVASQWDHIATRRGLEPGIGVRGGRPHATLRLVAPNGSEAMVFVYFLGPGGRTLTLVVDEWDVRRLSASEGLGRSIWKLAGG